MGGISEQQGAIAEDIQEMPARGPHPFLPAPAGKILEGIVARRVTEPGFEGRAGGRRGAHGGALRGALKTLAPYRSQGKVRKVALDNVPAFAAALRQVSSPVALLAFLLRWPGEAGWPSGTGQESFQRHVAPQKGEPPAPGPPPNGPL